MVRATGKFGSYWRCPKWGCEFTRDSQGRSKEDREGERDEEDRFKRRYE